MATQAGLRDAGVVRLSFGKQREYADLELTLGAGRSQEIHAVRGDLAPTLTVGWVETGFMQDRQWAIRKQGSNEAW